MRFQRLDVQGVRNLQSISLSLSEGFNFFRGDNGAGKTALLEAVHVLCRGRSFRTPKIQTLIGHDCNELLIRATGQDEWRGAVTLGVRKDRQGQTDLRLDAKVEKRISEIARLTPLQVLLPDVADLVFGGPGERRRWLDWGTFHVKHEYLVALREFLRSLKQRNSLLKARASESELGPWTHQLVEYAETVTTSRAGYLQKLIPYFLDTLERLAPELKVEASYQPGWNSQSDLAKVLGESRDRELKSGVTQAGPHRADVALSVAGAPANTVLSRGQAKLVASALLVSQAALLAREEKRASVFLIDDMGAELDLQHNRKLLELLRDTGAQILATGTVPPADALKVTDLFRGSPYVEPGKPGESPERDVVESSSVLSEGAEVAKVRMFHVKQGVIQSERWDQPTGV